MGHKKQNSRLVKRPVFKHKRLSFFVAAILLSTPLHAQNIALNLPSQPLQQSIKQLAKQSGIEIISSGLLLEHKIAPHVQGNLSVDQALNQLLQGSGLSVQKQGSIYVLVEKTEQSSLSPRSQQQVRAQTDETNQTLANKTPVELQVITVHARKDRDQQGYEDVYEKNYSSAYAGKDLIERFKGTSPADLLKGMSNVYSGDARNSGALDPNIRGMQGQGRVPVTIDGTEQALTVWRGYNGANSRSYIDPNLISSLKVVKGTSLNSDIKTGIAGGVAAKTLDVNDIVKPDKHYGVEIKIEGANNTVKEILPKSYVGQDYRDVMDRLGKVGWSNVYEDPLTSVQPKNRSDKKILDLQDQAFRIAVATKQDTFDLLAAYAFRSRGNYLAGDKGSKFFLKSSNDNIDTLLVPNMAKYFGPDGEVTNTSSKMESYLLKGTWRPSDDQALQLSYRNSKNTYGEIMPSRIWWYTLDGLPQWPLSEVVSKAYQLEYKFNPDNSPWVNLKVNLWQTDTESKTYSSGGFVNTVLGGFDYDYTYCHPKASLLTPSQLQSYQKQCSDNKKIHGKDRTPNQPFIIVDTAFTHSENTRKGASFSNKFGLADNLNLTVGADLTKEKLTSQDQYINDQTTSGVNFRMLPRAGRRAENQYYFNFEWQATSWLSLTAGSKSVSYWSFDDFLNKNKGNIKIDGMNTYDKEIAQQLIYTVNVDNYTREMYEDEKKNKLINSRPIRFEEQIGQSSSYSRIVYWYPDENGKYTAKNNPFLNGTIDISKLDINVESNRRYVGETPGFSAEAITKNIKNTTVEKKKDHKNWAPSISAVVKLNENNRFYINYSEAYRLPSLFETTLGFSASQSGYAIKPEHANNWEVAYVYNMADLLKVNQGIADLKLAYFNNKTKDVIERNNRLVFTNIDEQKIAGWELAARYDHGKLFGDVSLVWNKQNQVCDESSGLTFSKETMFYLGKANKCVKYGFQSGYLVNMALPEYQTNVSLGTRLLDNKLELGSRIAYFKGFKNPYINIEGISWFNQPLQWRDTWTVDAYAHYQHNKSLGVDLIGTNITNQYYLDPISRTPTPAPGRTVKLGVTYKY